MPDNRVRAPIDKAYDLAALDAELGGHGLCGSEDEIVCVAGSPVTLQQLEAAITAHVPPVATIEEKLAALGLTIPDLQEALGL